MDEKDLKCYSLQFFLYVVCRLCDFRHSRVYPNDKHNLFNEEARTRRDPNGLPGFLNASTRYGFHDVLLYHLRPLSIIEGECGGCVRGICECADAAILKNPLH